MRHLNLPAERSRFLISGPFHHGLIVVFTAAVALSVLAGIISLLRGEGHVHSGSAPETDRVAAAYPRGTSRAGAGESPGRSG